MNVLNFLQVSKLSVSALLIWKPATGNKKSDDAGILRLLFVAPNAHQARVLAALEGLHAGLPCIRQAIACASSEATASGASRKPTVTGAAASHRPATGEFLFYPIRTARR